MLGRSLFVMFLLFVLSPLIPFSFAQGTEDPAGDLSGQEEAVSERYTADEFSALSDADKREVYLNYPQMLPENFDPSLYIKIMHPSEEAPE